LTQSWQLDETACSNSSAESIRATFNLRSVFIKCIFRFQKWDLHLDGNIEKQIETRGVLDSNILPYYPYRDDAVALYKIIRKYVTSVVKFFYGTQEQKYCHSCSILTQIFYCRHP
jgi:hypothetical protein